MLNRSTAKKQGDPRVNQLLARADALRTKTPKKKEVKLLESRSESRGERRGTSGPTDSPPPSVRKSKVEVVEDSGGKQEAFKLESEAESLIAEDMTVLKDEQRSAEIAAATAHKKMMKMVVVPPKANLQPAHDLKKPRQVMDHMGLQKKQGDEESRTTPLQDRTRVVALLGQLPTIAPLSHLFASQKSRNANKDVAQLGLAATGAGLMAVEPATGGMMLVFSGVFHALTADQVEEPDEEPPAEELEREQEVHEMQQSGLFTAKPEKLGWLLA